MLDEFLGGVREERNVPFGLLPTRSNTFPEK